MREVDALRPPANETALACEASSASISHEFQDFFASLNAAVVMTSYLSVHVVVCTVYEVLGEHVTVGQVFL